MQPLEIAPAPPATPAPVNVTYPLKIFLSHKLGPSKAKAERIAAALSLFAGDKLRITCSATFAKGIDWEETIKRELKAAHWFILIYDGPDVNHDWCLFEAGFFLANDPGRKLICLHDPRHSLPPPLRQFVDVPARAEEVMSLFQEIYFNPPWAIKPELLLANGPLPDYVNRIVKEINGQDILSQFTLSPTFTFQIRNENISLLSEGIIDDNAEISGDGAWEAIFGKPDATISWTWKGITDGLDDWQAWAYQLAGMMAEAITTISVNNPSTALRVRLKNGQESIYRVLIRRMERTTEAYRFTFGAAEIVTSYRPGDAASRTKIFHLYNLAWFFKENFLKTHLAALEEQVLMKALPPDFLPKRIKNIRDDLKALHAEAQVRGIEDNARVVNAFRPELRAPVAAALQETWPLLDQALQEACSAAKPSLTALIKALREMKPINTFFLKSCLEELQVLEELPGAG